MKTRYYSILLLSIFVFGTLFLAAPAFAGVAENPESGNILSSMAMKFSVPLLLFVIGLFAGRFLKPWINKKPARLEKAEEIALIADRITDEMELLFPDAAWSDWIDDAVDKLIKSCGLTDADDARAIAHREIASQIVQKGMIGIIKPD